MKIMRVVELNLMAEKERVEYHLEEVINSKDINPSEKIKQINNKAAAVRVRKNLQEVKNISQKLRLEINENRKQWD